MLEFYNKIYGSRYNLGYDIDGITYKINGLKLPDRSGNINKAPRSGLAHKIPAAYGKTKLVKISVQVDRTGVLIPIAELVPINIGGFLIKRTTLHNYNEIRCKDIREGNIVVVKLAYNVIPYIVEVDKSSRPENTAKFKFPKVCRLVYKLPEEAVIRCSWIICKTQIIERLNIFFPMMLLTLLALVTNNWNFL